MEENPPRSIQSICVPTLPPSVPISRIVQRIALQCMHACRGSRTPLFPYLPLRSYLAGKRTSHVVGGQCKTTRKVSLDRSVRVSDSGKRQGKAGGGFCARALGAKRRGPVVVPLEQRLSRPRRDCLTDMGPSCFLTMSEWFWSGRGWQRINIMIDMRPSAFIMNRPFKRVLVETSLHRNVRRKNRVDLHCGPTSCGFNKTVFARLVQRNCTDTSRLIRSETSGLLV